MRFDASCSVPECSHTSWARSWCKTHYSRWRLYGDPAVTKLRRLPPLCEAPDCANKPHSRWKKGIAVCQSHWQALYRYGQLEPPPGTPLDPLPICSVQKCTSEVRSRNAGLCEKHYGRMRRNGDPEKLILNGPMHRYVTGAGYIKVYEPSHPIADTSGYVFEHRKIAYDIRHGECGPCFWCAVPLDWRSAVIDHLNEVKDDNMPSNLVLACNSCNRSRGAMIPFLKGLTPQSFETLINTMRGLRTNSGG